MGDFDIKKMEEQATELEKDLIVKELETLDLLKELEATKEALKYFSTPDVNAREQIGTPPVTKKMNQELSIAKKNRYRKGT
ncbi:hypothetical protein AHAS_Ahas01G0143800 [Arachis hypogaea]